VRAEPACKEDRCGEGFSDLAADVPVMRDPERTDLSIVGAVAVQQHEISNSLVAPRNAQALQSSDRHTPHDRKAPNRALERQYLLRSQQLWRRTQMNNGRPQLADGLGHESDVGRQEEGAEPGGRFNRRADL